MKKIAISLFSLTFLLVPATTLAVCTGNGSTVVYVNGILTSLREAKEDLRKLETQYQNRTGDYKTKFTNGYNPSHVGGFGDLLKSIEQAYQSGESVISDTDLTTILLQIHPQVTTQKIVLVGHSQGTYYTNDMYKYLTKHGVSQNSIAVYNIATPASYVAESGRYLTSSTDKVINKVREALKHAPSVESFGAGAALATVPQTQPKDPLPPNTSFVLSQAEESDKNGGHSFSNVYLEHAPATIVSAINSDIAGLSTVTDFNGDCFVAPKDGVSYKTGKVTLGVMDFIAAKAGPALAFARDFAIDVGTKVPANFASAAGAFLNAITPTPRTANLPGSHDVVGALYGSSVTEKNLKEFGLLEDQGAAVALAVQDEPAPAPEVKSDVQEGVVLGVETEDIVAPPPAPLPQALELPPLYSVGGGGSAGFGGGGGSASAAPAQEEAAAEIIETPAATTTETIIETATTTETVIETATTTETATSTTVPEQLDASTLGGTRNERGTQANPTQKLGTGLSGVFGSMVYKINGSDFASNLANGYGGFKLYSCFTGSYATPCSKVAESDSIPQILSQSGNDAYLLATTTSAYTFYPDLDSHEYYYYLQWTTPGDWALYGAASTTDPYTNGLAEWKTGTVFDADANIADIAFRICNTAQCVLP